MHVLLNEEAALIEGPVGRTMIMVNANPLDARCAAVAIAIAIAKAVDDP